MHTSCIHMPVGSWIAVIPFQSLQVGIYESAVQPFSQSNQPTSHLLTRKKSFSASVFLKMFLLHNSCAVATAAVMKYRVV